MTRYALRVLPDPANPDEGPFVARVDVDARGGRGEVDLTTDPARALTWPSMRDALDAYGQQSTVQPTRPDGRPNKPLTAYSVTVEALEP